MLSLIKSKKNKEGGSSSKGGSSKRTRSLLLRVSSASSSHSSSSGQKEIQPEHKKEAEEDQLLINSSGGAVLLKSSGGPSFGFTAMEVSQSARPSSRGPTPTIMSQHSMPERPSSRSSNSSRRSNQPRLGVGGSVNNTYLFEDDPGIMSEVETSSTRFRRTSKDQGKATNSHHSGRSLPRTSPSQAPARGHQIQYSAPQQQQQQQQQQMVMGDDDPGIMSEAETSSTARTKRGTRLGTSGSGRHSIPMGALTLNRSQYAQEHQLQQQRSVQFRHPVAQFHGTTMFDDDPGIMSEVETAATTGRGRRQQVKQHRVTSEHRAHSKHVPNQKDALPIVRTPSKTLERPLGLVFLVYRGETKRALLPNEITSLDTVKALFVRSFQKTLTMEYMDTPRVKIYIHDSGKDIFYELENLTEIRDRTILKLFEADSSGRGPSGLGPSGLPPITNADDDISATAATPVTTTGQPSVPVLTPVAEPEYVDTRHIKAMKVLNRVQKEYEMAASSSATLPRNTFSALEQEKLAAVITAAQNASSHVPMPHDAAASGGSTGRANLGERSKTLGPGFMRGYKYNAQQMALQKHLGGSSRVESGYVSSPDGNFDFDQIQQQRSIPSRFSALPEGRYYHRPESTEEAKARMMHMEAQLSQLTGMVEKALKNKKLGKKTVSFDKAVSYSDEQPPQGILTNKRGQQQVPHHSHNHNHTSSVSSSSSSSTPEVYTNLKRLQRSARDLRSEVKVLRRLTQLQSMAMKDLVQDTYLKLREACIAFSTSQSGPLSHTAYDLELWRVAQDEETFSKELNELVQSIGQLEAKVEETRSGVINKKNKIMLADVESMALVLSKCSRTVTQLKQAFPTLEANMRSSAAIHQVTSDKRRMMEEFLKRAPDRMENVWRRCKKLTSTLVTLKRLASVQEQRFHPGASIDVNVSLSPTPSESSRLPPNAPPLSNATISSTTNEVPKESTLDDLLDALQTYSGGNKGKSHHQAPQAPGINKSLNSASVDNQSPMKRASAASSSSSRPTSAEVPSLDKPILTNTTTTNNGPLLSAVIESHRQASNNMGAGHKGKSAPPPPPPRSSSASKAAAASHEENSKNNIVKAVSVDMSSSSSSTLVTDSSSTSSESVNSQDGTIFSPSQLQKANSMSGPPPVPTKPTNVNLHSLTAKARQDALEVRHQELLSRQKQLQEQYQRLQQMSKKNTTTNGSNGGGGSSTSSLSSTSSTMSNKDCNETTDPADNGPILCGLDEEEPKTANEDKPPIIVSSNGDSTTKKPKIPPPVPTKPTKPRAEPTKPSEPSSLDKEVTKTGVDEAPPSETAPVTETPASGEATSTSRASTNSTTTPTNTTSTTSTTTTAAAAPAVKKPPPPAIPARGSSSLNKNSNNTDATSTQKKDQKIYETDII